MSRSFDLEINPKILYWIDMPADVLSVKERTELLLNDVLVKRIYSETLDQGLPADAADAAFLYNFDQILAKNRGNKNSSSSLLATKFAEYIRSNHPTRALVHTTLLDKELADRFRRAEIPYLEKNIDVKSEVNATMLQIVKIVFRNHPKLRRKYLRLEFKDKSKFQGRVTSLRFPELNPIEVTVRDISLNGIGFSITNKEDFKNLHLKDPVRATLEIEKFKFDLNYGFVTRVFSEENELGISFNTLNNKMVSPVNSNKFSQQLNIWVRDFAISR